jgi:UDP-N-acetylmuramoyl-tripeptide--D-alanyl-D-alanine ligase
MPEVIATIVLYAAFTAECMLLSMQFVHMLQLNAYRNERYIRWLKQNRSTVANQMGWLLIAMIAVSCFLIQPSDWMVRTACSLLLLIHAYLNKPKKAKKPLVFTARVKRLFLTLFILMNAVFAVVYLTGMVRISLGGLFLWAALTPLSVPFANLMNQPIENAIANRYRRDAKRVLEAMPQLIVIGITGSYGKTSTKNFLGSLLSVKYNVLITPENYNTTMGIVRTVREYLRPTHQIFIAEMGAKNTGDIGEICRLVRPKYGMITSIGEQHLETFKTVDNIIKTKFELADSIPDDGLIFLNADNPHIQSQKVGVRSVTYSIDQDSHADYKVKDIKVSGDGSTFTVVAPDGEARAFSTKLLGAHNIQNIVGGIAVAHQLGITLTELVVPIKRLKPVEHRLQLLPNGYIDDAYNSNPAGFRAALDVLSSFEGQRVLVTPGMVELGERQDALNRELGSYAATRCDYAVLVGEKQAPPLKDGLIKAGFPKEKLFVSVSLEKALEIVKSLPDEGKRTVLLENDLPDNF